MTNRSIDITQDKLATCAFAKFTRADLRIGCIPVPLSLLSLSLFGMRHMLYCQVVRIHLRDQEAGWTRQKVSVNLYHFPISLGLEAPMDLPYLPNSVGVWSLCYS